MKHTSIALAALVALSAGAHAQQAWTEIEDGNMMVEPLGLTADELDGTPVYDTTGERLGEIDDILMATDGSSMAASLDVGGFLGIGETDVVVPLDSLTRTGDGFSVDMTKEQLEALPDYEG